MAEAPRTLTQVVDCICDLSGARTGRVTVADVREAVGSRAFGPLLLLAGLVTMTPISAAPGVPSLLALCVLAVAGQMVVGSDHVWLPRWALALKVDARTLRAMSLRLKRPAEVLDRYARPRLGFLTAGLGRRLCALACMAMGLVTPLLELIPFSTALSGAVVAVFGLGLTTRDGVLILGALFGGVLGLAGIGYAAAAVLS